MKLTIFPLAFALLVTSVAFFYNGTNWTSVNIADNANMYAHWIGWLMTP
ncbi:MAG: hypothetical protein NTW52_12210 [Planctomycetota bacterium]|nr:hypothetical protein [Planctomycetota bacterium]